MALSIDGHAIQAAGDWGATTSSTITLTTSHAQDLIVVVCSCEVTASPHATISSVTATGLTFTKRSSVYQDNITGPFATTWNTLEVWSATASSALSSKVITITASATIDCGMCGAFGVNYDGVSLPVWSSDASLPHTTTSSGTSAPSLGSNTTDNAALLFGFTANAGTTNETAGTSYTLIDSNNNPNGGVAMALGEEYESFASSTSNQTVSFGTSWQTWAMIVDAIEVPSSGGLPFANDVTLVMI